MILIVGVIVGVLVVVIVGVIDIVGVTDIVGVGVGEAHVQYPDKQISVIKVLIVPITVPLPGFPL